MCIDTNESLGDMGGVVVDKTEAPKTIFGDDSVLRLLFEVVFWCVFGPEIRLAPN